MRILVVREQMMLVCGVSSDNQKRIPFSMEKELYLYLPGLLVRMKITKIPITARFLNHNRFGWFR